MNIKSFCGGFDSNFTYLIWDDTNEAVIIDASNGVHPILDFAEENGLKIKYVFLMHSHFDHLEGVEEYRKKGIEILGHESMSFKLDKKLKDGEIIKVGEMNLKVLHTPGHIFDSICVFVEGKLFTSDTLFVGCIGRSDLDGANVDDYYDSLYNKILKLPDNTEIYPGHDYGIKNISILAWEKEHNSVLMCKSKDEFVKLVG